MRIYYCTKCNIDPQELFKNDMICPKCGDEKTGFFDFLPVEYSDLDIMINNLSITNAIFGIKND
jgi:RNA polymerase subunit RPABC4/transcription elongation factor Spt4